MHSRFVQLTIQKANQRSWIFICFINIETAIEHREALDKRPTFSRARNSRWSPAHFIAHKRTAGNDTIMTLSEILSRKIFDPIDFSCDLKLPQMLQFIPIIDETDQKMCLIAEHRHEVSRRETSSPGNIRRKKLRIIYSALSQQIIVVACVVKHVHVSINTCHVTSVFVISNITTVEIVEAIDVTRSICEFCVFPSSTEQSIKLSRSHMLRLKDKSLGTLLLFLVVLCMNERNEKRRILHSCITFRFYSTRLHSSWGEILEWCSMIWKSLRIKAECVPQVMTAGHSTTFSLRVTQKICLHWLFLKLPG